MLEVRLIDANAFIGFLHNQIFIDGDDRSLVYRWIEEQPTIEAESVRNGRWIDKGSYAVCTECGEKSGTQYDGVEPIPLMTQFCPHCGAKMR